MSRNAINANRGRHVDRRLMQRVGRPTLWESADLCPNLGADGQHPYHCPDCISVVGGRAHYIYTAEENNVRMIWMRDDRKDSYDMEGAWEKGSAIAVFPAHLPITDQDRLTVQDLPIVDRILVKRGSTASTADILRSPNVVAILSVRAGTTTYTEGTDFTLQSNAAGQFQILWTGQGNEPAVETHYSVRMQIKPTWLVIGDPKIRAFGRGRGNQLMKTATCQRFDISLDNPDQS